MNPPSRAGTARSLLLLATLFFMWGFMTSLNDILIPYLKGIFELTNFQSMLVQFAFFGAYFLGSLAYFLGSASFGDPIARIGYQRAAVLGLLVSATGAGLFYPASVTESYPLFLGGLFTIGLGFTVLQIAANPYVIAIGSEETAAGRLNLCQGVNSFGHTLGPLIGGWLILKVIAPEAGLDAESVRGPYLALAGALLALAVFFSFAKLPRILAPGTVQKGVGVLRRAQVRFGILAIFFYVGAEVSVASIMIEYLGGTAIGGLTEEEGSAYVALFWGGLMIGRFLGAVQVGGASKGAKALALALIPAAGFLVLAFLFARVRELDFSQALGTIGPLAGFLVLNVLAFLVGGGKPARTVGVFALVAGLLLLVSMNTEGSLALWTVVGIGLFNSIMWSNVFALSIEGLGKLQAQASSLLVMAIVGGALLPPLQGLVADELGVQQSFFVPLVAYLYLAFYGFSGHRIGRGEPVTEEAA